MREDCSCSSLPFKKTLPLWHFLFRLLVHVLPYLAWSLWL